MSCLEFIANVVSAVVLGAGIGYERQWRQRLARRCTNALVATGATAFVALSAKAAEGSASADRTWIAAQAVSEIGSLGGGIILQEGLNVRGLNTAATLRCPVAVGSVSGWATGCRR